MNLLALYTVTLLIAAAGVASRSLSITNASISAIQEALSTGHINAIQLTAKHLHRLALYDRRGGSPLDPSRLNSIPILNPSIFTAAQESDTYRATHNGSIRSPLEGIPGTIKDSYMMAGLTVAAGSPAFVNLTAISNAFTVQRLRDAGALILGKTNMPPMANGGMQRGVYGRAESPYNSSFLAAAYASGSSNGAGVATAAGLGVFAMAEETVSSGRSPASNNGLVAYTPSRGLISIRGNWPLMPEADVVVPYARSVEDLLGVLDVVVAEDRETRGDFWRGQPFVELPAVEDVKPNSYLDLMEADALRGKRIGVPRMYIGKYADDPDAQPTWVSSEVRELWAHARERLEGLGAVVEEVDFPLITNFETPGHASQWETEYPIPGQTEDAESGPSRLGAYAWDDFLRMVNDTTPGSISSLFDANLDPALISPQLPGTLPDRYGNTFNNRTASNSAMVASISGRNGSSSSIYDLPSLQSYLSSLETRRKHDLESWLDEQNLDTLVWPAAGDIGRSDAETNETSALHAWRNGVFFSHGNYAIRRFGVPTITVPMGLTSKSRMPVGLTFAGRAYDDSNLLSYGFAFEAAGNMSTCQHRSPPLTPELPSDIIDTPAAAGNTPTRSFVGTEPPRLNATARRLSICAGDSGNDNEVMEISGCVEAPISGSGSGGSGPISVDVEVFVDGVEVRPVHLEDNGTWRAVTSAVPYDDPAGAVPVWVVNKPDQSLAMVVVVASAGNGRSDGKLLFV
ncbi:amidase signature domain-containing protein [Aspergillus multicolor]|uniref:amidase signature domain-containing protein n=1 Tax=Aspergillus multicolor TaxID=41759 RepID=UPI003CCDFBF5